MHPFGIISLFSRVLKYAVMHSNLIKIGILLYKLTDNFAFNENAQHKFLWRIDKKHHQIPTWGQVIYMSTIYANTPLFFVGKM